MVDSQGRKWEVLERKDGSVVCYYTREGDSAHWVVWDSLDRRPTPRAADGLCPNCGRDYFENETIVDGELRCSCARRQRKPFGGHFAKERYD